MFFAIKTLDHPDSGALREKLREAHLDYLDSFAKETVYDGPFLTDDGGHELGSFKILELADRAAAQAHIDDEPFITGGLQHGDEVWRYEPVVAHDWRNCPRTPGLTAAMVLAFDNRGGAPLRERIAQREAEWFAGIGTCLTAGMLVSDDGGTALGTLLMFETPDMDAAHRTWEGSPALQEGLFGRIDIHRWRFGRTFDRLKPRH
ncbi:MAG: YciI family protein [Acetobacterales bacterium]